MESYAGFSFDELPEMSLALALTGLVDTGISGNLDNSYPTILLHGDYVNTGTVEWETTRGAGEDPRTVPLGLWSGDFTLPGFDSSKEYIEVWWAMQCGNDAVLVTTQLAGAEVPVPSSLLLCGIGLGFVGLVRRMRRKS